MIRLFTLTLVLFFTPFIFSASVLAAEITAPAVVFKGASFSVSVEADSQKSARGIRINDAYTQLDGQGAVIDLIAPSALGSTKIILEDENGDAMAVTTISVIPAYASLAPPVVAIIIALTLRSVLPALFLGVWSGAWLISGLSLKGLGIGFLDTFQRYTVTAMTDPDHVAVILFTLMMGGMVNMIIKNGGMTGVLNLLMLFAKGPRGGQVTISSLGFLIFFDDVANTLLIGNTMRPVADRLRISREKLAYLVDSTAAPVASLAFATTWIGYEVSLIADVQKSIPGFDEPAYFIFLNSIAYSFYPLLTLLLVWVVALSGRDFGPMLAAEKRARLKGPITISDDASVDAPSTSANAPKPHALNALIPIAVLIGTLMFGLYITGEGNNLRERIGTAESFKVLMWASMLGAASAGIMSAIGTRMSMEDIIEAWHDGLKTTLFAMIVLVLAWAISDITQILNTASYLISLTGDNLPMELVPAVTFILSATVAFSTGTSWGTMGIMLPLMLPLAWGLIDANDAATVQTHMHIIYASTAAVLAGATFGDHSSPISDTTVLSSLATGCDHIEHVRTQIPYALLAGLLSTFACLIPVGYGMPWWVCLPIAGGLLILFMKVVGKYSEPKQV